MSDIDFINVPTKQRLNRLFFKNPEEIFGYVTGTFAYLGKSFARIFTKKPPYSIEEEIKKEKENYGHILDIQGNTGIILEYIL